MGKYLIKRLLHGIVSIIIVVGIVMLLIFSLMDRNAIFGQDPNYTKVSGNQKIVYQYTKWQEYGYLEYTTFNNYINLMIENEEITEEEGSEVKEGLGLTEADDSELVRTWTQNFAEYYEKQGFTIERLNGKITSTGVQNSAYKQNLLAVKDLSLFARLWDFFSNLIQVDSINYVTDDIKNRGIHFTFFDPVYNGAFSPAIIGTGTENKYLLYFDSSFPFIHQNLVSLNLGKSYAIYSGKSLWSVLSASQGEIVTTEITYETGKTEVSGLDLHSAKYSYATPDPERFVDNYSNCSYVSDQSSPVGLSFTIGILATILAYLLGVPLGILMARHKNGVADKIGTVYIVFILAVPSLAYIFMFSSIGSSLFGLPTHFGSTVSNKSLLYVLPIISLALPQVANLMKWIRRYMIDQMNSDYVKFARSGGLSEGQIFTKHILKNAAIPIVHGIPGAILGCLTGAIITETVYSVPGTGRLLTTAINKSDNGVIVGLTLFYATLSVLSLILGDILMAMVDPRISFETTGGRR